MIGVAITGGASEAIVDKRASPPKKPMFSLVGAHCMCPTSEYQCIIINPKDFQ